MPPVLSTSGLVRNNFDGIVATNDVALQSLKARFSRLGSA
jgi:hypothetical protein